MVSKTSIPGTGKAPQKQQERELVAQPWGPESSKNPHKKTGNGHIHLDASCCMQQKQKNHWGLLAASPAPGAWESLSQRNRVESGRAGHLTSPSAHTQILTYPHAHTCKQYLRVSRVYREKVLTSDSWLSPQCEMPVSRRMGNKDTFNLLESSTPLMCPL